VPRYLVVRKFDVGEDEMPEVGNRSRRTMEEGYPEITWEHSHVVVGEDGNVMTYCVYAAPTEEMVRAHAIDLGRTRSRQCTRSQPNVTPADFPPVSA